MIIAIASGKGGTGKTTVSVNMALSLGNMRGVSPHALHDTQPDIRPVRLIDCDVEEPNSNLFLNLTLEKTEDVSIPVPVIDETKCIHCGKCSELCQYNALAVLPDNVMVFEQLCHGCGLCLVACPQGAISEKNRIVGVIEKGIVKKDRAGNNEILEIPNTGLENGAVKLENGSIKNDIGNEVESYVDIEFFRGLLTIGEAMSTPIIKRLKEKAEEGDKKNAVILDVPPGTACPVIEAISGVDYCLLVTEPTPFGLYDLKIAVELCRELDIRFGVIINRDGAGNMETENFCNNEKIPIILKIPYDKKIAELYSEGIPFVNEMPEWREKFRGVFEEIVEQVK